MAGAGRGLFGSAGPAGCRRARGALLLLAMLLLALLAFGAIAGPRPGEPAAAHGQRAAEPASGRPAAELEGTLPAGSRQAVVPAEVRVAAAPAPALSEPRLVRVVGQVRRAVRPLARYELTFARLVPGRAPEERDWDLTDAGGRYQVELSAARYVVRDAAGTAVAEVVVPEGAAELAADIDL